MKLDIKIGDIVVLKSGGPKMTVETIKGDQANVVYYDTDNKAIIKTRLMVSSLVKSK